MNFENMIWGALWYTLERNIFQSSEENVEFSEQKIPGANLIKASIIATYTLIKERMNWEGGYVRILRWRENIEGDWRTRWTGKISCLLRIGKRNKLRRYKPQWLLRIKRSLCLVHSLEITSFSRIYISYCHSCTYLVSSRSPVLKNSEENTCNLYLVVLLLKIVCSRSEVFNISYLHLWAATTNPPVILFFWI